MLPPNHPDRIQSPSTTTFDDHRLVANAGLILPATLARRLGLPELVHNQLDLGRAPGWANTGDKMMTLVRLRWLVATALTTPTVAARWALRLGRHSQTSPPWGPSTLGAFLRSFRWGHVRQLDRVSRELLSRAWAAGAGPGPGPLTIDLDSTICATYGLAKEGARHHGYTGARGYHPLLAVAAGTGDVLMARLREPRLSGGAAHFLRRWGGCAARGQGTTQCGPSLFYTHWRRLPQAGLRFSRPCQRARLRNLIGAIPEDA